MLRQKFVKKTGYWFTLPTHKKSFIPYCFSLLFDVKSKSDIYFWWMPLVFELKTKWDVSTFCHVVLSFFIIFFVFVNIVAGCRQMHQVKIVGVQIIFLRTFDAINRKWP